MKSLSLKLLFTNTVLIIISVLIVSVVNYNYSASSMTQKVGVMMTAINDQMSLGMDNYFDDIEEVSSLAFRESKYYQYDPTQITEQTAEGKQLETDIKNELLSISLMQNFGDFCIVYSNNSTIGKTGSQTKDIFGDDSIYQNLSSYISNDMTGDGWFSGVNGSFQKIYYVKRVNDNAVLLTSLYTSELENVITNSNQMQDMVLELVDDKEQVIYSNVAENVGTSLSADIIARLGEKSADTFVSDENLVSIQSCNDVWKMSCRMATGTILRETEIMKWIAVIIAVICIIGADIVGVIFALSIVRPIKKLVVNMKLVEDGDLTVQMDSKAKDEVGMLIRSFGVMLDKIRALLQGVDGIAATVAMSSEEIKEVAEKTQEVSKNVTIAMDGIAASTANQLVETKHTFSSLENLAENINHTITNIEEASGYSAQSKQIGETSLSNVQELQSTTELANNSMSQVGATVTELVQDIAKVQDILELIRDISAQTNLLSLNASIEAARAGEAGRGFAVVANEVQKLAEQTKQATVQIDKVIQAIVKNGQETKEVIDESAKIFEKQREIVQAANTSFESILEATQNITMKMAEVEELTASMSELKDTSLEATNTILEATETSSVNAEEVMSTTAEENVATQQLFHKAEQLGEAVASLQDSLKQFKI